MWTQEQLDYLINIKPTERYTISYCYDWSENKQTREKEQAMPITTNSTKFKTIYDFLNHVQIQRRIAQQILTVGEGASIHKYWNRPSDQDSYWNVSVDNDHEQFPGLGKALENLYIRKYGQAATPFSVEYKILEEFARQVEATGTIPPVTLSIEHLTDTPLPRG